MRTKGSLYKRENSCVSFRKRKKAWEQPVVFRPSEEDRRMLDWLSNRLYLKPAQVLRPALKKLYDL